MPDLSDVLEQFLREKRLYHFEGDSGLEKFETVLQGLGYREHPFRFGSVIEAFLSDNPGAVQAILEWIPEQNVPEWTESLNSQLNEPVEEEDE